MQGGFAAESPLSSSSAGCILDCGKSELLAVILNQRFTMHEFTRVLHPTNLIPANFHQDDETVNSKVLTPVLFLILALFTPQAFARHSQDQPADHPARNYDDRQRF